MKNEIGVIYTLSNILKHGADELVELGVGCVQILNYGSKLLTKENAEKVMEALEGKVRIAAFWSGWTGPIEWDFVNGPETIGLVPTAYRFGRLRELMEAADFAEMLGAKEFATHFGYIPENPSTAEYVGVLNVAKKIALYCKNKGMGFNFETGQETPTTLMRLIKDIDLDNVGINLDPANLLMYGKGNPVDALDLFKGYIRGVHVKDGEYPTDFYKLGNERVVGEGAVNFPVFLPKLINQGYQGDLFIEREITGEQQMTDIKKTMNYIKDIMNTL